MKQISSFAKYALAITIGAAILAACSNNGGSSMAPSGPTAGGPTTGMPGVTHIGKAVMLNGLLVTAARPAPAKQPGSPVSPDKKKKKKFDQYISNFSNSEVLVFDYPKGTSSIGTISGVSDSQGECTFNGKGTFWVTASGSDTIDEFKFGGTSPIATLSESTGEPASCAIDPGTGDLATTILSDGDVIIYPKATGSGTVYTTSLIEAFFDGYDNSGNLFVDGFNSSDVFQLIELPKGSSNFKNITVSNTVSFPGGVQFDGKYVTVNDQLAASIYQYTVSGSNATLAGTVALSGSSDCVDTWIAKNLVFCPDAGNNNATVYNYPAGGSAIATLSGSFDLPISAMQIRK